MTEQPVVAAPTLMNKTLTAVFGVSVTIFAAATIVLLLIRGTPGNSMHESALAWSYSLIIVMVIAFGLGNAVTSILALMPKR